MEYDRTDKIKVVIVCGPTGIGKTSSAIEVSKALNGEIINADSMQIYRYMDIGTAKPTPEEQAEVRHHLIDIVDPDEHFDAKMYSENALETIQKLHQRGIVPFVVGGAGLYIKALAHGLFESEAVDTSYRKILKALAKEFGGQFLHDKLGTCDPEAAEKLHPNDVYRIIRALEVYKTTGKSITRLQQDHGFSRTHCQFLKIGLNLDRKILYERIDRRVDIMIENGLLEETRRLLEKGYAPELKSMQSIGYRHMTAFIQQELSWAEAVRTLKRDTRRYAKRQMTWFQSDKEITWVSPHHLDVICDHVVKFFHK